MKLHDAMRELAKVKFTPEQQAKNLQALREENAKRLKEIERMKAMPDWKAPAPVKPPFVPPARRLYHRHSFRCLKKTRS